MRLLAGFIFLALLTTGCSSQGDHAPVIGEAYAGPATLVLREEINPHSAVAGTAHHGERLEIIQQRRRFVRVRTAKGQEGWTDERMLLSPDEIARLRRFSQQARNMPSQGAATTYDALNIHIEPSRFSPSFLQVKPGEKLDVIGHEVAPRKVLPRKPLVAPAPRPVVVKKSEKAPKYPPPPAPAPPKPPDDWLTLSKTKLPEEAEEKDAKEEEPMDDWSLVRTAAGPSGWVLTRRLFMSIPDEVAQYAEGRRITSYFPLGEIRDGDQVKKIWLWTTIEASLQPYDFDSYRVFVWSLRHHRYETAYIQRRVQGYFPVLVEPPGFSVCVDSGGEHVRRIYSVNGITIRPAGQKPCEPHVLERPVDSSTRVMTQARAAAPEAPADSLYARARNRLRSLRKRWFNR
ncbi:MAG TPA: hypothetical protein VJN43_17170 [Bryobacteraceae bacterium]|nr:hypothetical protein [Bryobacteraceae bacterium]